MVSVAIWIAKDNDRLKDSRVVLSEVAPKPWRLTKVEEALRGKNLESSLIESALEAELATA